MKKNKITFFAMELILLVLALFFVWKIFIQNVPEKRVAVILPESGDQRWDSLIKGMKQSAKENHIHLVICNTDDIENAEAEKEAIEEQKNNHIDAFIVLPAPSSMPPYISSYILAIRSGVSISPSRFTSSPIPSNKSRTACSTFS